MVSVASATITVVRYRLHGPELPPVETSLPVAETARRAVMHLRLGNGNAHSPLLTGKTADGAHLSGHQHAFFLVTDEDGDGRLDHLTVHCPAGIEGDDLRALTALQRIFSRGGLAVGVEGLGIGDEELFSRLPLFQPATRWRSVTPFVPPCIPTRGKNQRPRPRDLPAGQLVRELARRGYPEPLRVDEFRGDWSEFQVVRFNGTTGFGTFGFEIEFPQPVSGPLALGFGCHFSLGLFAPVRG